MRRAGGGDRPAAAHVVGRRTLPCLSGWAAKSPASDKYFEAVQIAVDHAGGYARRRPKPGSRGAWDRQCYCYDVVADVGRAYSGDFGDHWRGRQRRGVGVGPFGPDIDAAIRHILADYLEPQPGRHVSGPHAGPGGGGGIDADRAGLPGVGDCRSVGARALRRVPHEPAGGLP